MENKKVLLLRIGFIGLMRYENIKIPSVNILI